MEGKHMDKIKIVIHYITIMLLISIVLVSCMKDNFNDNVTYSMEALKKGLLFAMSEPNTWRDPHGLVLIGSLKPFIIEHFGEEIYQDWLIKVLKAICFSNDSLGVGVDALDYPDYPEDPKCLGYPDGHETAVAIIGIKEAGLTELNGHYLNELTNWLKYYPDHDQYSKGVLRLY
jgi:hypothetical protein